MKDELTHKQRLFVEAYLINPNATAAAREAGYKGNDRTLSSIGTENLAKPLIRACIDARLEQVIITKNQWFQEVTDLARTDEKGSVRIAAYAQLGKALNVTNNSTVKVEGDIEVAKVIKPKRKD